MGRDLDSSARLGEALLSVWKACEQTPLSHKQAGVARGFCHAFDMYFQVCKGTWRIDVMGEESQACVPGVLRTCHPLLDIWWASCWTAVLNVACAALLQPWRTSCIYFWIFCNRFGARAAIFKVLCVQPCRRLGFRGLGRIQSANSKIS